MKKNIIYIQNEMKKNNIDAYLVSSSDPHSSEYVPDYFKARDFLSGFTGSNGDMLITKDEAALWTDGRYFIQAEREMKKSGTKLYKQETKGTPTIEEYLINNLNDGATIGINGKNFPASVIKNLNNKLSFKNILIKSDLDFIKDIWINRGEHPDTNAFIIDKKYSGEDVKDKINKIRDIMKEKNVDWHFIGSLDDIAWLFNFRARDIEHTPVAYCYAIISKDKTFLFISNKKQNDLKLHALNNDITMYDYNYIEEFIKTNTIKSVLLDPKRVNYYLYKLFESKSNITEDVNPSILLKSIKNEVEIKNTKRVHIIDGVASAKFMCWIKSNYNKKEINEYIAEEKLYEFRSENKDFIENSFSTISAFGPNAAMMHYKSDKKTASKITEGNLYLIDSGGQYYGGTTDITRTYAIGKVSNEKKIHFTRVLKAMINLSLAVFLEGCSGLNLDILSRIQLWKHGIDYRSGTGHGIGYMLGVHESPNGFRWKVSPNRYDTEILREGMITTVEPGIYIEGSHGIRIENMLITRKKEINEYGQFMHFENIAFCPIDIDAIIPEMLDNEEKNYLNDYHEKVYKNLKDYMNEEEKEFLKKYTRKI